MHADLRRGSDMTDTALRVASMVVMGNVLSYLSVVPRDLPTVAYNERYKRTMALLGLSGIAPALVRDYNAPVQSSSALSLVFTFLLQCCSIHAPVRTLTSLSFSVGYRGLF